MNEIKTPSIIECETCKFHKIDEDGDTICHHPTTQNSYPEGVSKFMAIGIFCKDFNLWRKK